MFSKRKKKNIIGKSREFIYPSMGIKRVGKYYVFRIARIDASSHTIALGFAIGAGISFSPLVGLHFLSTILICFILRANIIAGLLGSILGNPWTWSIMWLLSYKLGVLMGVGGHEMDAHGIHNIGKEFYESIKHLEFKRLWYDIWPTFYKILLGTIPSGILFGVIVYFPVKYFINKVRKSKH